MSSMNDLLDFIRTKGPRTIAQEEQNKEEFINFNDNPLLVIMGFTELHSTVNKKFYSGVFDDDNDKHALYNKEMCAAQMGSEFDSLREKANEIIEFYKLYMVSLRFRFAEFTKWQESLLNALQQISENRLQIKLLPLVAKLPVFYEHSLSLTTYYEGRPEPFKHPKDRSTYVEHDTLRTLTYINFIKKPASSKKDKISYLFEDKQKYLYEIEMTDDPTIRSAMLKLFEQPVTIKCDLRIKDDIENNASFYCCDAVKFV
jgi:hypothetical protein